MLKYKIVEQHNAFDSSGEKIYYPRMTNRQTCDLNDLAKRIVQQSSLSEGDIQSVLIALVNNIPDLLKEGYLVRLGELGTFSLSAKCDSTKDKTKANYRLIKKLTINFRPGQRLKIRPNEASFTKVK